MTEQDIETQRKALKLAVLSAEVAIREFHVLSASEAVKPDRLGMLKVELLQAKQSLASLDLERAEFDQDA